MKSTRIRPCYGTLTLSRGEVRRLRQEWAVVETPLRPLRLAFVIAASVGRAARRLPVTRAAA